jgi:murein DD-endopeptidase MepM/ murein hydrolase activator NlpD
MPADLKPHLTFRVLAMPVLVTGILATMAITAPSNASIQNVASPTYLKSEPATTLMPAPRPRADVWELPVHGYHLTARFGESSGLWAHNHTGLDFAAPVGTPIHSVTSGVVVETGWAGSYGNRTIIRFKDGTQLWYCHQTTVNVHVGQHVMPGDLIGTVGATGNVTGPHLHLEVRPDPETPVDPFTALVKHGLHP